MNKRTHIKRKFKCQGSILLFILFMITGCQTSPPTQQPPEPTSPPVPTNTIAPTPTIVPAIHGPITLITPDGYKLTGFLSLPDEANDMHIGLVLGHEFGSSYHSWDPFLEEFTQMGYTVLAFDFRGHGESEGGQTFSALTIDTTEAIKFLKVRGFDRIVCMGSSMGGTGCLEASLDFELVGLVLISTPRKIQSAGVYKGDLAEILIPKLIMVAENDTANFTTPGFVDDIINMYEWSAEPKQIFLDPGYAHGVAMLLGEPGEEARSVLLKFLKDLVDT